MIEEFEIIIGSRLLGRVETYKWNGDKFDLIHITESPIHRFFTKIEKLLT